MEITDTIRMQTYKNAPEIVRDVYGNEAVGERLQQIFQHYGFDGQMYSSFVHIFGDHILGLIGKEELHATVKQQLGTNEEATQGVVTDITALIKDFEGLEESIVPIRFEGGQEQQAHIEKNEEEKLPEKEQHTIHEPSFLPQSAQERQSETVPMSDRMGTNRREQNMKEEVEEEKETPSSTPSYAKPLTDIPRYDSTYEDPYHEKPDEQ